MKENTTNMSVESGGKPRASPNVINIEVDADSSSLVTKMKFGDLADSIINKDYGPSATNQIRLKNILPSHYPTQESTTSTSHEDQWKHSMSKRVLLKDEHDNRAMEKLHFQEDVNMMKAIVPASPKNQSMIEPISPPESNIYDKRAPQSSQFTLDCYVKSRIAEAMRTESDKRNDEHDTKRCLQNPNQAQIIKDDKMIMLSDQVVDDDMMRNESNEQQRASSSSSSFSSASYAYPFSALSMSASSNSVIPISQVSALQNADKPSSLVISNVSNMQKVIQDEPKPLLSSQYEALSDED